MTSSDCLLAWNVRGLNDRARRNVVRELLLNYLPSVVCIQETKLSTVCNAISNEILGPAFDYECLPSVGASGGILFAWLRERWTVSNVTTGRFTLSSRLTGIGSSVRAWWMTIVYGPQLDH